MLRVPVTNIGKASGLFRLYSKKCEYVLRALLCVGRGNGAKRFRARDICKRAKVPEAYSRKVFQSLVQGGFLRAVLGPGGGYELTRDPARITLLEVIQAVDGDLTFSGCPLGLSRCGSSPCALHVVWGGIREELLARLRSQTLSGLIESAKPPRRTAAPATRKSKSIERKRP